MASGTKRGAWIITLIAVAAAFWVGLRAGEGTKELQQKLDDTEAAYEAKLAALESRIRELTARADERPAVSESLATPPERVAVAPAAEAPEAVVPPGDDEEEKDDAGNRQQRIADAQMKLMIGMAYTPLFDELALDSAVREDILALAVRANREAQRVAVKAIESKDTPASEVKAREDEAKLQLRKDLEGLLDPAELAAWDEYEAFADQILYAQLLDGQLTMLAPGLGSAGREAVKEVFAEELVAHLDAFGESDAIFTLDTFNQAQLRGLKAGLERLDGSLDLEEYNHAVGFVRQVEVMFDAMAE